MDIQELVRAQRAYFLSGATRPYAFRMEQLKKLQRALQTNEKLLEQAMYQDFRKAPMEVYMCETGMVLEELRFHLKHLKGWMRERAVPTPLAQFHAKSFVSPEPYGVALIISPWNYPVQLCLSPLVGAISGGNCAIVKPSAYAPATSAAIAKLIAETFDPRYIAAVEGGRAENSALLSQRFDTIFVKFSANYGCLFFQQPCHAGKVLFRHDHGHFVHAAVREEFMQRLPVCLDERGLDRFLDQQIVRLHAGLPGVQDLAERDAPRGQLHIGGFIHDDGAFAAKLQCDGREIFGRSLHHDLADGDAAGEENGVEALR